MTSSNGGRPPSRRLPLGLQARLVAGAACVTWQQVARRGAASLRLGAVAGEGGISQLCPAAQVLLYLILASPALGDIIKIKPVG